MRFVKIATAIIVSTIVGVVCVLVIFAASNGVNFRSLKAYVILSGSMEPELKVGGLAIVAKANNYLTNEIISFSPSGDPKDIVTHRIIVKEYPEGVEKSPIFLTAGDANKNFDFKKIKQEQIIGKVIFSIPYLGYIANFFKEPYGFILFFIVPVTIIVYEELKTLIKEIFQIARKFSLKDSGIIEDGRVRLGGKVLLFFPVLVAALALTSFSVSFFSDRENSVSNSFVAGEWVPTPTPTLPITPTLTPAPTSTPTPTATTTPTPQLADHIVISEIQTKGNGSNNAFVELYNPTNTSVDISSWSIQYRGGGAVGYDRKNFESGNTIPANGFFLIGHNGNSLSVTPDMAWSHEYAQAGSTIFLVNNQIDLIDATDSGPSVVDKVAYGTGANLRPEGSTFSTAPAQNQSIERKAYSTSDTASMTSGSDVLKGNAYDSENNTNDFVLRTLSQPQNSSSSTESP